MSRAVIQRLVIGVLAILAAVAVVRVVVGTRTAKAKGPEIHTAKVERGDVVSSVSATGTLQALTTVDVKSNVGGRVDLLTVDVGYKVKNGQLIAKIDPTDTQSNYNQALADNEASEARLKQAWLNLTLQDKANIAAIRQARQQLASARAKELQARQQKDAQPQLSDAAVNEAQANLNAAQEDLNQLQVATIPQSKAQAQANYDQAMADLENARKNRDRQKALLEKGFVPMSGVDDAEQKFANAQAAVHQAKAKLDTIDRQYAAAVESAKARVAQQKAALYAARQNKVQDKVRLQDWEAAKAAVDQAEAQLNLALANQKQYDVKEKDITAARAQLAKTKAALTTATTKMGYVTITAPRDGVILQKYIEQGTIIASGQSSIVQGTNIVQIGDTSRMFVMCNVDETDISGIEPGQPVDVKVDAYPNELFEGKVVRVDPQATVSQNVTTIAVKVEIMDPDARLKPTMDADCEFITAKRENVIAIPNEALHEQDGTYTVTVMQGGKQVQRQVEVGIAGAETTEVRSGLKEGEEIVTEVIQPETTTAAPQQPNSPFNPIQNRFRPRQPGGGGGARGGGGGR